MTDKQPPNLCSNCRDSGLSAPQERQTGICITCLYDMADWLFEMDNPTEQ